MPRSTELNAGDCLINTFMSRLINTFIFQTAILPVDQRHVVNTLEEKTMSFKLV